jgi:hypothetical protein
MKTTDYDLYSVDPDDVVVARDYASRRAQAALALQQAQARRQQIADTLAHDPAASLLAAVTAVREATAAALADATTAQAQADTAATAAARFAANDLAQAQADFDAATRAVSDALAELLKQAQTSTALTATVDGLALRDRYTTATAATPPVWDHTTIPFRAHSTDPPVDPELVFPAADEADYTALLAVLDRLVEHVDTVADLVTAESVHQLVQGNPVRSGAALDIAATGSVPDEFEVIRTPRPGHDITHRVLVLIDPQTAPGWTAATPSAAAIADPVLAAWASRLLPDPTTAHVAARRLDPNTGTPSDPLDLTAETLGLDPLSWVRLAVDPAELHQRVAQAARGRWARTLGDAAATGQVLIDDTAAGSPSATRTLADLLAAAAAVHDLIAAARALAEADLTPPSAAAASPDIGSAAEAATRVTAVEQKLNEVITTLDTAANGQEADALIDALFAASALGEAAATPQLDTATPDLATLREQAATALPRLRARTTGGPFSPDPNDPAGTLTRARARLASLCGVRLPILTTVPLPADGPWQRDLAGNQLRLLGADQAQVRAWLHTHARVRPAVEALLAAHDLAETLDTGAVLDVRATQLPAIDPASQQTWVGADPAPPEGLVDLIVQRGFADVVPAAVTGLAVDAWTQVVPAATHATGIAFHYDQPDATPPQALLVAVGPDLRPDREPGTWDLDTLLDALTSTLALARDRAVAAEHATTAGLTVSDMP